jgi:hypothetical protein
MEKRAALLLVAAALVDAGSGHAASSDRTGAGAGGESGSGSGSGGLPAGVDACPSFDHPAGTTVLDLPWPIANGTYLSFCAFADDTNDPFKTTQGSASLLPISQATPYADNPPCAESP